MEAKLSPFIIQKITEKLLRAARPIIDYKIDPNPNIFPRSKAEVTLCQHNPYCNSHAEHEKNNRSIK